ncbi:MAG: hypothetical protein ACFE9L_11965 [Candidatus Hodarchaeota archaeon]
MNQPESVQSQEIEEFLQKWQNELDHEFTQIKWIQIIFWSFTFLMAFFTFLAILLVGGLSK